MPFPISGAGRHLSRRSLLRGGLIGSAALAAGGLSGCSPGTPADQIQFWHLFTGPDGAVFTKMLDAIGAANPDISIQPIALTWGGPYYTKLAMASVGGRPPDVAAMHLTRIIGYVPGGLLDPWDLDEFAKHGITQDMFPPLLWEKALVNGELYALPMDFHAFPLIYNIDLCEKAGVLGADGRLDGISSPEAFLDTARRVAEATGQTAVSYGYTGDGAQCSRMFWGLYGQTGASIQLTPGQPAQLDTDAATRVITFVQDMLDNTIASAQMDYSGSVASFISGRSAINFNGNWEISGFTDAGLKVDAMPMPAMFGHPGTYGDSHTFVLPKQTSEAGLARREAVYRVVAGLIKDSLAWTAGGHIPANKRVVESPDFQQRVPLSHYAGSINEAVFDPPAWFTGSGSGFQAKLANALTPCWLNRVPAEQGTAALVAALDDYLDTTPPA